MISFSELGQVTKRSSDCFHFSFQPDVSVEAETGKMYRATFADREGRAVVIMRPAKQVRTRRFWRPIVSLSFNSPV